MNAQALRCGALVLLLLVIVSCMSPRQTEIGQSGGQITLTYWSATNAQELEFANRVAAEWNTLHRDVQIKVEPVPSGQSSEEVILAAIASGTTPDIYANVFPGAMQDLLDAQGLVQLDAYADFFDVLHERMMPDLSNQYRSSDGHFYQVPWKSNPIMVLYNTRLLREAGVSSLPTTYSEFLSAAARVTRDRNGDGQIDQWMLTIDFLPLWYKRLFDFLPLYLAASNGQNLLEGRQVRFENEASVAAFRFLHECFAKGYAPRQNFQGDAFLDGRVAARFVGPNSVGHLERYRPADFEYEYGVIPRPDAATGQPVSYADPKSIVIFKTCQHPREAWEFIKFIISKQNDLQLLELSSQLPIRAGLLEDQEFADYFRRNPKLVKFAAQVTTARSIESVAELKEILDVIAQELEASVVFDLKPPEQSVHDAARRSQQILDVE
ncbi:MAG TPA: extracellular solute-binding protein [Pyrinomonadaceae bacterium]|nr:extracellular solute-binding protein [Pyrinomonadaceae bacterium]